jgi:hypothetical protein
MPVRAGEEVCEQVLSRRLPIYQHDRAKGLPTTAALVVIARRIARMAWSVYTHKTDFDPKRVTLTFT